jgi:TerC family integral membrane protein
VFDYFKVPMSQQQKVLGYGIGGAMAMRAAMIVAGYEAITNFKPILLVFAGILIFSSYKLIAEEDEEEEDMSQNAIVKFASSLVPVSDEYDGDNFFTLVDGVKTATPLLLCLVVIELSDVVFAVDSIPAVFGVTQDPLIVYSSNIFAILGLRSLYAFVATMVAELEVRSDEPVFVFRAPVAPRATAFARRAPFLEDFARARLSPSLSVVQ